MLSALSTARVFLALAARALETQVDAAGLVEERTTDIAIITLTGRDGTRALPAFADGHAVQRWRPEARPLPLPGQTACATAVHDGATGLLVDPHDAAFLAGAAELAELAAGRVPVPGAGLSTRHATSPLGALDDPDEALVAALGVALAQEPVTAARLLAGPDGPVLGVVPATTADPAALAALADRVARRLGDRLPAAGLDLAAVPAVGPGTPVPLGRRRRRWWGR